MERWTKDEFREFYRAMGEPSQEAFVEWLEMGVRSVQRWLNEPDKQPNTSTSRYLDAKLRQAVCERIGYFSNDFVDQMHRRDLLRMLYGAASVPVGGARVAWDARPRVSAVALDGLEEVTTALASKYTTKPAHALLGAAAGHLEKVSGLLRNGVMKPAERERLESIVADVAIFVGVVSMQDGRMAQAGANFELAKRMARQAGNMTLLAQALAEEALLDYYERSPETADDDPRPRIELLERAQALAKRHAPPIVQMAISGWLAQDKAVAKDGDGANEALEWSHITLERAKREGPVGTGFVSSAGLYSGYDETGNFEGFRGRSNSYLTHHARSARLRHHCGSYGRGTSVRGMRPAGRRVMPVASGTGPGGACRPEARTMVAVARVVSSMEKYWPMRALGPPPNGR